MLEPLACITFGAAPVYGVMRKSSIPALQGQILGLRAILTTILTSNRTVKLDHHAVGKIVMETPLETDAESDAEIREQAREIVHDIANDMVCPFP